MKFNELPEQIKRHMNRLIESSGIQNTEKFKNLMAETWDKKCQLFEQQTKSLKMISTDSIPRGDSRGAIVLTYSGSIVGIGPKEKYREVEYASIHLRSDVPKTINIDEAELDGGIKIGEPIIFSRGKLKKTSPAYKIAVCEKSIPLDQQKDIIREGMIFITNGFMKINRSLHIDKTNIPDQFTVKSMARYIAKKYNITGTLAKKIIDDYLLLIETGILLGETVPLGRIGRISLKRKGAQRARIVKHPETGEEIIIKAKPPRSVPKISFSSYLKEKAAEINEDTLV
ncbi:MAG: hypothetical protein DRP84_03845 [Spirochaetes bacterium]|nr:MAG: hypothetical protein DRP84_03845 [Spirochaetota bacterium]